MAIRDDNAKSFFGELEKFVLHLPGNQQRKFSDNQTLLEMADRQYPNWKDEGTITSIPVARVPKLFLRSSHLDKKVEKVFKHNRKGDDAEKKLFQLIVEGPADNNAGVIVFPNFDASHIFKSPIAKVEIDIILMHFQKGIFLFNIKNVGGKGFRDTKKIPDHIEKHRSFIRMLMEYKPPENCFATPIHTIICDFAASEPKSSRFYYLESKSEVEKIVVLSQRELNSKDFGELWKLVLLETGVEDIDWNPSLDLLVARLIALASIEGAAALIHKKMQKGLMQAVSKGTYLENQIRSFCSDNEGMSELIMKHSSIKEEEEEELFILWTKDQMEVISTVFKHLVLNREEGLRLLVTGGKGSGKTMLLIFLAKLAQSLTETKCGDNGAVNVLVCDGSFNSIGLFSMLRETFKGTGIYVFDPSTPINLIPEHPKGIPASTDLFRQQCDGVNIILCDETMPTTHRFLMENVKTDQHLVMFSSSKIISTKNESTTVVKHLGSCLRSTCQIARFANCYIENGPKNIIPAFPINNLAGEPVNIIFVLSDNSTDCPFLSMCYDAITEEVEKHVGTDFVLVVPFMGIDLVKKLIASLKLGKYSCLSHLDGFLGFEHQKEATSSLFKPDVFFCDPFKIEGCEFPVVLILIDARDLEVFGFSRYGNKLATAVTRASFKVKIIVNQYKILEDNYVNRLLTKTHDQKIGKFIEENRTTTKEKSKILLIGKKPDELHQWRQSWEESEIPNVDGISLYVGDRGKLFHAEDVYSESDLQKLKEFGVEKISLANECVSNIWSYFFARVSALCIIEYNFRHSKPFELEANIFCNELMKYQVNLHLNFLRYQSGDSSVKIPNFWLDFETEPVPKYHKDNWKIWKSKAEELMRFGAITSAVHVYECCIKLLKERLIADDKTEDTKLVVDELVTLSATASSVYLEHTSDIVQGTKFEYVFRELLEENCIMKAFTNAFNVIKLKPCSQEGYRITEKIIKKIEGFCEASARSAELNQLAIEDKLRKNIHSFRQSPLCPFSQNHAVFQQQMSELDHLVSDYNTKRVEESNVTLISLRKEISRSARNASETSLSNISETLDLNLWGKETFLELFIVTTQIFDYSIQLGMEALYWDPSNPKCKQVILCALKRFDFACESLRNASHGLAAD